MHLDAVKEKLGPLPVWAWAGIIVGGGVVFLWWRSRDSGAAADSTDGANALDAGSDAGDGTSADGFNGGWDGSGIEAPVNTPAPPTTQGGSTGKQGPGGIAYNSQPYSRQAKNPGTGEITIVSGMGHWVKPNALSKKYNWVAGPAPTTGIHAKLSKAGPVLVYPGYTQNEAYEATHAHPEQMAGKSTPSNAALEAMPNTARPLTGAAMTSAAAA